MLVSTLLATTIAAALLRQSAEKASVAGDRAIELGYEPVIVDGMALSPAWGIDTDAVRYDEPPEWLDKEAWRRELRLWACECAERVLPFWTDWAEDHEPRHLDAPRNAIEVARKYARKEATLSQLDDAHWHSGNASWDAGAPEYQYSPQARSASNAAWAASLACTWDKAHAGGPETAAACAITARSAVENATHFERDAAIAAERAAQHRALAERLDRVAPWAIGN